MKWRTSIKLTLLLCVSVSMPSMAHPGRTDANGCHTNRKTGEYHCHGTKSRRVQPIEQARPVKKAASVPADSASQPRTGRTMNGVKKTSDGGATAERKGTDSTLRSAVSPSEMRERCMNSNNINAYWEATSERCLDRATGRVVTD